MYKILEKSHHVIQSLYVKRLNITGKKKPRASAFWASQRVIFQIMFLLLRPPT